ncbi:NUDIX hydrolase [Corynebacterium striatum]
MRGPSTKECPKTTPGTRYPHRSVLDTALPVLNSVARHQFPGGKPDPGESPLQAAVREVGEEIGVTLDGALLSPRGTFRAAAANEENHEVIADIFSYPSPVIPNIAAEIAEYAWVDLTQPHVELAPLLKTPALREKHC